MPASVVTKFDPSRLNAQLVAGFKKSVAVAAADAQAHSPSPTKARAVPMVRGNVGYLLGKGPLAHIMEGGTEPHVIAPRKLGSSRRRSGKKAIFAAGYAHPIAAPVAHPGMRKRPYLGPAGQRWAQGGCRTVMRAQLAAGGFR